MIITFPWLKEHLNTKANERKILEQLTNIGLEVESVKENLSNLSVFKIAKILKITINGNFIQAFITYFRLWYLVIYQSFGLLLVANIFRFM